MIIGSQRAVGTSVALPNAPSTRQLEFLAWLQTEISFVDDDLKFVRSGGKVQFAIDFNVIQFCLFPFENRALARIAPNSDSEFQDSFARVVSRIITRALRRHTKRVEHEQTLSIFAPHRAEFERYDYTLWSEIENITKRAIRESESDLFNDILQITEEEITVDPDVAVGIARRLRDEASSLLALLQGHPQQALATYKQFSQWLAKAPTVLELPASFTEDAVKLLQILRALGGSGSDHNIRRDVLALQQLAYMNWRAAEEGIRERTVLLTTDGKLSAAVNFLNTSGLSNHLEFCHVRNFRLVPLTPLLTKGVPESILSDFVNSMSVNLRRLFDIKGDRLTEPSVVLCAYARMLARASPRSHGREIIQRGVLATNAPRRTLEDIVLDWSPRSGELLGAAQRQLTAGINLVMTQYPPRTLLGRSHELAHVIRILRHRSLTDAINKELFATLRRAVLMVDLTEKLGAKELLDAIYRRINRRLPNEKSSRRLPVALRSGDPIAQRYTEALHGLVEGEVALDVLLQIADLSPFNLNLATAYVLALDQMWERSTEYCNTALTFADTDPRAAVAEAYLLFAVAKRLGARSPADLAAASKALEVAGRESKDSDYTLTSDLRFESETIALSLAAHNWRFFLGDTSDWTGSNFTFIPWDHLRDRLFQLQRSIVSPLWHDPVRGIELRLRTQVHVNVCGYWLVQWLRAGIDLRAISEFWESVSVLEEVVGDELPDSSYVSRVVYRLSAWWKHRDTSQEVAFLRRALAELNGAISRRDLLPYEGIKFRAFRDRLYAASAAEVGP